MGKCQFGNANLELDTLAEKHDKYHIEKTSEACTHSTDHLCIEHDRLFRCSDELAQTRCGVLLTKSTKRVVDVQKHA